MKGQRPPEALPVRKSLAVLAAACLTMIIWSGSTVVTKIAVVEVDPVAVGALRIILAALLAGPIVWASGYSPPGTAREFRLLALSAFGGYIAFPILFSVGLKYTSASHGALIITTIPIFAGITESALNRTAPPARWWLGVSLALAGEFLLIFFRLGFGEGGHSLLGDLVILLSCLIVAISYISGARLSKTYHTWPTTLWGILLATLVLLPVLWWRAGETQWAEVGAASWLAILYLAVLASIVAYGSWYWALNSGGVMRVSVIQFLIPILTLIFALLLLGERITLPLAAAAALIILGVYICQERGKDGPGAAAP